MTILAAAAAIVGTFAAARFGLALGHDLYKVMNRWLDRILSDRWP